MPEYGPFSERDLADKLMNVSDEQMDIFHQQRMKKYRIIYLISVGLGVITVVFLFLGKVFQWVSFGLGIFGLLFFSYGSYKRKQWIRIYENMIYVKRKRTRTIKDQKKTERKQGSKYDKYNL